MLCYSPRKCSLDTIDVAVKELKNDKKVYQKTKAVSAREYIAISTKSIDSIIREIPGVLPIKTNSQAQSQSISTTPQDLVGEYYGRWNHSDFLCNWS
ncbi:MAG: hypothetical protein MR902_01590 [Campylobacter sp.]|nr:hypothetical protein [Campylobacter sp.]